MLIATKYVPLSRRLMKKILLAGIASISLLSAPLYLSWQEKPGLLALASLILAPIFFLFGIFTMWRELRTSSEIEHQLFLNSTSSEEQDFPLSTINGPENIAMGWNRLIDQTSKVQTLCKLESRLNESLGGMKQQKLQQILDSLPDGMAVTDQDGQITFANRALFALLGQENYSPENYPEQPLEKLITSITTFDAAGMRKKLQECSRSVVLEVQRTENLAEGVLRIARYPMMGKEGNLSSHVWSIRDVTQYKLAEEMRDQFVSTATHELRTPLANIKAFAEILSQNEDIKIEEQREFCNIINTESTRLSRFIDELLDVNRMESGAMSIQRSETDVERLVNEVIEKVRPQMQQKELDFQISAPAKYPKLNVDKDLISASLVNILGNAAKYTPEKGTVRFLIELENNDIAFHIEDTGIGLAEDEIDKVFDKFFRSEDTRVRDITGSGLGLSFTREAVRMHGGEVVLHSELNKGSRFTMTLPLT